MLIAVTSASKQQVDLHFGHADRFLIYSCEEDRYELHNEVSVERYCNADPNHSFHTQRFAAIAQQLEGCSIVITQMIGDMPKQALAEVGISTLIAEGSIDDALSKAYRSFKGA